MSGKLVLFKLLNICGYYVLRFGNVLFRNKAKSDASLVCADVHRRRHDFGLGPPDHASGSVVHKFGAVVGSWDLGAL